MFIFIFTFFFGCSVKYTPQVYEMQNKKTTTPEKRRIQAFDIV